MHLRPLNVRRAPPFYLSKKGAPLAKLSKGQSNGIKIEVTDLETNSLTTYHAIRAAARALDIDKRYIEHYIYLKQDKPVLDRYIFKLVESTSESKNKAKVQITSKKLEVTNIETKEVTIYSSISAAARSIGYRQTNKNV